MEPKIKIHRQRHGDTSRFAFFVDGVCCGSAPDKLSARNAAVDLVRQQKKAEAMQNAAFDYEHRRCAKDFLKMAETK